MDSGNAYMLDFKFFHAEGWILTVRSSITIWKLYSEEEYNPKSEHIGTLAKASWTSFAFDNFSVLTLFLFYFLWSFDLSISS